MLGTMRSPRIPHVAAIVLLGVGIAQASDAITFIRLLAEHGPAAEANPLAATLAGLGLLPVLIFAKVGVVGLVVAVAMAGWQRHPLATAVVTTFGVAAGLAGATSNVLVLLHPYAG
jgi:hypothetical protein